MDLTQIRYFLALARTLNFTRAAEACHVTQPALTKSIQRLEDELGGPLVLRERSHTQLTPLGVTMLPLVQQVFDAADAARTEAARFHTQPVERLRLGLSRWVEPAIVVPLLQELVRCIPKLEIAMQEGEAAALNDWLLASEIDIALTADVTQITERANCWPLYADAIVTLVPAGHALQGAGPLGMAMVQAHAMVGPAPGGPPDPANALYETMMVRHHAGTKAHAHAAVQAGAGLALSTERAAIPSDIVSRKIDPAQHLEIAIATMAGRPRSKPADLFLKLARARSWAN